MPAANIPVMSACLSHPLPAPWAVRNKFAHSGTSPAVIAEKDRPSESAAGGEDSEDGRNPPIHWHVCFAWLE